MNVPSYPYYSIDMDKEQEIFYEYLKLNLDRGIHIDIDNNHSYVFVYIDRFICNWKKIGFVNISIFLERIISLYKYNKQIYDFCKSLMLDCLLGLRKFEEYLEKTEPEKTFGVLTFKSNQRLNIQKHIGLKANPIDILLLFGSRKSKFTIENQGLYKDKIREVFNNYGDENQGWFNIFQETMSCKNTFPDYLLNGAGFSGVPYWDALEQINEAISDVKILCFYTSSFDIKFLTKRAENLARVEMNIPEIGSCWISETNLFKKIEKEFSFTTVIQHGQPKWLGRQHFDIWIPDFKIAIEYHGKQHFEAVDFFGGQEAFQKTVERDIRKQKLAESNNVKMFVVTEENSHEEVIKILRLELMQRKIKLV